VNRIDGPIAAATQIVRLREIALKVRLVVAARVVVLDFQVPIEQKTLRDDQIVRPRRRVARATRPMRQRRKPPSPARQRARLAGGSRTRPGSTARWRASRPSRPSRRRSGPALTTT
jgi:hypothetical protein